MTFESYQYDIDQLQLQALGKKETNVINFDRIRNLLAELDKYNDIELSTANFINNGVRITLNSLTIEDCKANKIKNTDLIKYLNFKACNNL